MSMESARPRNLSHLAIGVRDMDASLNFYRDVIGLSVGADLVEDFSDGPMGLVRRAAYLRWSEGDAEAFIVLDQTLRGPAPTGEAKPLFDIGLHHFGFWVDDVAAIVGRAKAAGVGIVMEPFGSDSVAYGEAAGRPILAAMLKDPDGNVVQLDERRS
jgi:catechol 2,3-dioxygenase-like lactoylglutathione lyase family enzyme